MDFQTTDLSSTLPIDLDDVRPPYLGLQNENIVCFAKDWTEDPTSNNYVMRELARHNRVLWLNSIAMRTPKMGNARDMGKIKKKLRAFAEGPQEVEPGLNVFTPLVLPFPHSDLAVTMNRQIVRGMTWALRRKLRMESFQLWTFLPTAVRYVGGLDEDLVIYYVTDEYSQFASVDGPRIKAMEEELMRKADIVFCTSVNLVERKKAYNPNTFLASHGVDQRHFATVFDDELEPAPELASLPGPKIGFFGLIEEWIDLDIVAYMAEKRPDWWFPMIGTAKVDISKYAKHKNILWLGRKPYQELPSYCKAWDVGIMPFAMNELSKNINPIKLREYLSAGLPVVSTDIPECKHYPDSILVGRDPAEFLAMCEKAMADDTDVKRRQRSDAMRNQTWAKKVEALGMHVKRVAARKGMI